uniref:OBP3 n=1 Tax=Hycleus cichorii TaxID=1270216 RepID=A0A2U9NJF6_9CUCU|nr:OBP3 [Hycleus cichorii]
MKILFVIGLILATICYSECVMTEKQMEAAKKLIRNVCQPKFKVADERIEAMHKGDWTPDKPIMCYNWCVLNMYKLISKDNQFNYDLAVTTLKAQAPLKLQETALKSIENCKDAVKTTTDKCAAGFEVTKCIFMDDPEHYFLP